MKYLGSAYQKEWKSCNSDVALTVMFILEIIFIFGNNMVFPDNCMAYIFWTIRRTSLLLVIFEVFSFGLNLSDQIQIFQKLKYKQNKCLRIILL